MAPRNGPTRSAHCARSTTLATCSVDWKPVNWCFDCGSALAEAEVEYHDKTDIAVDVGFRFAENDKLAKSLRACRLPYRTTWAIW